MWSCERVESKGGARERGTGGARGGERRASGRMAGEEAGRTLARVVVPFLA